MGDFMNPPRPRAATWREQPIIDEAHRLASLSSDPDARFALREAVRLIVKLIDERDLRRDFLELYDRPHED